MPLWLNADIISGPVDATSKPLDADRFLSLCQNYFPNAVLSVGWTTRFGPDLSNPQFIIREGAYSAENVVALRNALVNARVEQPVTFPVRAGIVASPESRKNIIWLLDQVRNVSRAIVPRFLNSAHASLGKP